MRPKKGLKLRVVQCAGVNVGGVLKGFQCKRTARLPVDANNNTLSFFCHGHRGQRGKRQI